MIRSKRPITGAYGYDIVVFSPQATEQSPFSGSSNRWRLDGHLQPRLGHGYVFTGCPGGALRATTFDPPKLESIVGALWDLASWAQKPWQPYTLEQYEQFERRNRRARITAALESLWDVAIILAFAAQLRGCV